MQLIVDFSEKWIYSFSSVPSPINLRIGESFDFTGLLLFCLSVPCVVKGNKPSLTCVGWHKGWSEEHKEVGQKLLGFPKAVSHYAKHSHSSSSSQFPLHGRESTEFQCLSPGWRVRVLIWKHLPTETPFNSGHQHRIPWSLSTVRGMWVCGGSGPAPLPEWQHGMAEVADS